MKQPINIVWYKRDLRVDDHAALHRAAASGVAVIPLYVVEPEYWQQKFSSRRHWHFIYDCLIDLRQQTAALGQPLVVRVGEIQNIVSELHKDYSINGVYAHEESGNQWTYSRDKAFISWCRQHKLPFYQYQNNAVVRRLKSRDHWAQLRQATMSQPLIPPPEQIVPVAGLAEGKIPLPDDPMFGDSVQGTVQQGGRFAATAALRSFLTDRSAGYVKHISRPGTADRYCSRLSAHLTWGSLSVREVVEAINSFLQSPQVSLHHSQRRSLSAFSSRLSWRCHFIQKLEDQPQIEFKCMHSAYETIRHLEGDLSAYTAWAEGNTGYPLVDACMRSLIHRGWITFRMRAMLVSFASYHLWLDWRQTGYHLARLFTDYEPGIHYSQLQMQSGVTGINAVRIYNPIKQSHDQDSDGEFIRRWVPELRQVPNSWIHEPWLMSKTLQTKAQCMIGTDYPEPIVDHARAIRAAREKLSQARKQQDYKTEANQVFNKLGSRNRPQSRKPMEKPSTQMSLFL